MIPRFGVPRWRGSVLVGVVIAVLVAGVGLAVAGDGAGGVSSVAGGSSVVDPEVTRAAAVAYLMGRGVSERDAQVRMSRQSAQIAAATRLRRQAPDDIRSVWIDDDGVLMAAVRSERGETIARAAGAVPVFVTLAAAELESARTTLIDDVMNSPPPGFGGASFETDERAGKVVARYFFGGAPGAVPAAATQLGDIVRATAEPGELGPNTAVAAGLSAARGESYCTMGWAVDIVDGPEPDDHSEGIMTAGHCFYQDQEPEETVFSFDTLDEDVEATGVEYHIGDSGDYGYLQLDAGDVGSPFVETEFGFKFVKEIGDPVEGAVVCKFGLSTDETCGQIERVDVSNVFDFGAGNVLVRGLTRTSYCALHGDSGAPVYTSYTGFGATDSSITALGIHSGGLTYPLVVSEPSDPEEVVAWVCGEKVGERNEGFFTPLSNIDTGDRFFVKISGG